MPIPTQDDIANSLRELLECNSPPLWLLEMIEHYRRTGMFRPGDLQKIMGDPTKGVRFQPDTTVDAILNANI
jgi:hypothetical protein